MLQHRTVFFLENILPNVNDVIRINTDYEAIKCSMVQFTESYAIINSWWAFRLVIWNNVCGIEQLPVLQLAERAL